MSAVVDIGDAFELSFQSVAGAAVAVTWADPGGTPVLEDEEVAEGDTAGTYPITLVAAAAGMWTATFTAAGTVTAVEQYFVRARSVTGLPPLAAVGDVVSQFGELTAAQEGITSFLLRAASSMVRHSFPYVDAHVATGRLSADLVALAVSNMVLRVLRNPNGLRGETVGPFSRTYDTTVAAGLLAISATEEGLLTPGPVTSATSTGGVGTIRVRAGLAPPAHRHQRHLWLG
jgi:hypothetical protein